MPDGVTVVIPTRNRSGLLRRALVSALGQRGVDVQVVVVDEASSDGTSAQLAALGDERVVVVRHEEPRGVSAARNAGLERAAGRWVAFLDDDDVWAPDKLEAMVRAIHESPGAAWACTSAVWMHDNLRLGRPERVSAGGDVSDGILRKNVVPGGASNVLADTALVRSLGGFDTQFMTLADWDLWTRLGHEAALATVDRPLHGYFVHAGSMAHDTRRTERELALIRSKYSAVRRERGITLDEGDILQYLGAWALRERDRRAAARMYWRLATGGHERPLRSAAACVLGAVWPGVQHVRDRRGTRRLPPGWRETVEAWVAPLRSLDRNGGAQEIPPRPPTSAA